MKSKKLKIEIQNKNYDEFKFAKNDKSLMGSWVKIINYLKILRQSGKKLIE